MDEKVIQEFRIIETEAGFRIEIKGDKERLREMGIDKGLFGFGPMRMGHGFPFGRHHGHHERGHHGFPFGHGPWGRGPWWAEHSTEDEPQTKA